MKSLPGIIGLARPMRRGAYDEMDIRIRREICKVLVQALNEQQGVEVLKDSYQKAAVLLCQQLLPQDPNERLHPGNASYYSKLLACQMELPSEEVEMVALVGAIVFLDKPYRLAEMARAVREALDSQSPRHTHSLWLPPNHSCPCERAQQHSHHVTQAGHLPSEALALALGNTVTTSRP